MTTFLIFAGIATVTSWLMRLVAWLDTPRAKR